MPNELLPLGRNGNPLKPGRPKGAKGRVSVVAKSNIDEVFAKLGGVPGMLAWAKADPDNLTHFYTKVYTKLVGITLTGAGPNGEHLITPVLNVSLSQDDE